MRLRTVQTYYRQMRLVSDHFGVNPKGLTQKQIRGYVLYLKSEKGWAGSSIRQAIASCRMFYCEMLGKSWKLWDVVRVRDTQRLPVVLSIEEVRAVLGSVKLLRHRTPLRLIYCCGLRLNVPRSLRRQDRARSEPDHASTSRSMISSRHASPCAMGREARTDAFRCRE